VVLAGGYLGIDESDRKTDCFLTTTQGGLK